MAKRAAGASVGSVAQAAREALAHGNAVDAVIAGVLVAAAETPSVLLGPVQLLVGGAGAGLRAIDGRVRQPGLGVPRPRGALSGQAIPAMARVGVPAMPATLATAHASLGSGSWMRTAAAAIDHARALSAERGRVFERLARRGAAVLTDDAIAGELTAVAGRAAGGLLTVEDLGAVRPVVASCDERALGPAGMLRVPWREEAEGVDATTTQVVAAADGRGMLAIACYDAPPDGVPVPGLGLLAPAFAAPVMRGEARVRPGEPRPAAAPIVLRAKRGVPDLALGVAQAADAGAALEAVVAAVEAEPTIAEAVGKAGRGRPVAVVRTREAALVVAG